jgi:hypothetical protein
MVVLHARADARAHRFTTLAMISPAAPTVFAIEPRSIGLLVLAGGKFGPMSIFFVLSAFNTVR